MSARWPAEPRQRRQSRGKTGSPSDDRTFAVAQGRVSYPGLRRPGAPRRRRQLVRWWPQRRSGRAGNAMDCKFRRRRLRLDRLPKIRSHPVRVVNGHGIAIVRRSGDSTSEPHRGCGHGRGEQERRTGSPIPRCGCASTNDPTVSGTPAPPWTKPLLATVRPARASPKPGGRSATRSSRVAARRAGACSKSVTAQPTPVRPIAVARPLIPPPTTIAVRCILPTIAH